MMGRGGGRGGGRGEVGLLRLLLVVLLVARGTGRGARRRRRVLGLRERRDPNRPRHADATVPTWHGKAGGEAGEGAQLLGAPHGCASGTTNEERGLETRGGEDACSRQPEGIGVER